jgi:hypothetical protein
MYDNAKGKFSPYFANSQHNRGVFATFAMPQTVYTRLTKPYKRSLETFDQTGDDRCNRLQQKNAAASPDAKRANCVGIDA